LVAVSGALRSGPCHRLSLVAGRSEPLAFTPKLPAFTPDLPAFTPELQAFTPDIPVFSLDIPAFTPELPAFTLELPAFTLEPEDESPGLSANAVIAHEESFDATDSALGLTRGGIDGAREGPPPLALPSGIPAAGDTLPSGIPAAGDALPSGIPAAAVPRASVPRVTGRAALARNPGLAAGTR